MGSDQNGDFSEVQFNIKCRETGVRVAAAAANDFWAFGGISTMCTQ